VTIIDNATADDALVPYQLPFPADALSEIVIPRAIPDDERMWAP
jgi:2,4'-dihydroxyacetophenone dioxygenase